MRRYLSVIIHTKSDPIHVDFHHHHKTFRDRAKALGHSFFSKFASVLETKMKEEAELTDEQLNNSNAASMQAGFDEDPQTLDEFLDFEKDVVVPMLERIFVDEQKEEAASARRDSVKAGTGRVRTEWSGVCEE